jgi:hypothetical protein
MFIEDVGIHSYKHIQNSFKSHYMDVLNTIKEKGSYTPQRRLHWIRRILFCQRENMDYVILANLKDHVNINLISPSTFKEVCTAYIAAYDEHMNVPKKALLIRKHLIELLTIYVQSCHSLEHLEPQRSIITNCLQHNSL